MISRFSPHIPIQGAHAIRLPLGSPTISRVERNVLYAHEFGVQTAKIADVPDDLKINSFITLITGSDDEVARENRGLFPDTINFYVLRLDGGKKFFVRTLAQELMRSAKLDKREGTKVEINERIIAALSFQKLLQENDSIYFSQDQLDRLIAFNLSIEKKDLGNVRTDEKILLQSVLDQVIKLLENKLHISQRAKVDSTN